MSAVALRCDADADRMLAHLRERFAEVFPVTGSAGDGAGGDAGGNPDEGADGSADAAVRFAPVADRGSFAFASAPGRLEVAGNHVDHQGGRVISSAIGERTWGLAAENGGRLVRVAMEGFGTDVIDLDDADWRAPHGVETQSSAALLRGMLAAYDEAGGTLRGFDLATCSEVPAGCGLSSSAAFEVMVGAVLEGLFGPGPFAGVPAPAPGQDAAEGEGDGFVPLNPVALALAGVTAEQRYFGKPCGAQDQLASACGGTVLLDFASAVPQVTPLAFDATGVGYAVVLIDSRQDHSVHTEEFASVPADMRMVANHLGVARLGDTTADVLLANLQDVRAALGDGRAMRALHYFDEVARVDRQREALEAGDFPLFLKCVRLSGPRRPSFCRTCPRAIPAPGSANRPCSSRGCARTCSAKRAPGASTAAASAARCWHSCPEPRSPTSWRRWTSRSATAPAARWSWAAPACWRGGCRERSRKRRGRCLRVCRGRARQSFLDIQFSGGAAGDHCQFSQT